MLGYIQYFFEYSLYLRCLKRVKLTEKFRKISEMQQSSRSYKIVFYALFLRDHYFV